MIRNVEHQWTLVVVIVMMYSWTGTESHIYSDSLSAKPPPIVKQFSYTQHKGPLAWPLLVPGCRGRLQSPINLVLQRVPVAQCVPLRFSGLWDPAQPGVVRNTGHTAEVALDGATLSGGPLDGEYQLAQLHFHWGRDNQRGSEHTIGGRAFSMEVHAVHYNSSFGSMQEASKHAGGLAVVAFFLQGTHLNNSAFGLLTSRLEEIVDPGSSVALPAGSLRWLEERAQPYGYFVYPGSLTTPPCTEIVTWIVFPIPINIDFNQIAEFRKLLSEGQPILNNVRHTQPINGRAITYCTGPEMRNDFTFSDLLA